MNKSKNNQGQQKPSHGNQQQEFERKGTNPSGQPDRGRDIAEDRGQDVRNRPDDSDQAIPELDEPDVEGVGEEGRDNSTDATMPPGQGKDPKRKTM